MCSTMNTMYVAKSGNRIQEKLSTFVIKRLALLINGNIALLV